MVRRSYIRGRDTNGTPVRASITDHIEEKTMGMMGNMVSRVLGKGQAPATTTAEGQYIPASQSQGTMGAFGTTMNQEEILSVITFLRWEEKRRIDAGEIPNPQDAH